MTETVRCPGCEAELTLPPLERGQTVQCARCQQVFEPYRQRAAPVKPGAPTVRPILDDEPSELPSFHRVQPLRGAWTGNVAMAMLAVNILFFMALSLLLFAYAQLTVMQRNLLAMPRGAVIDARGRVFDDPRMADLNRQWVRWERAEAIVTPGTIWTSLFASISYLIWLWQASRNLETLRAEGLNHSPAEAVIVYFTPIFNLFRPYLILQEIWRASDPHALKYPRSWMDSRRSIAVRLWWFGCFAAVTLLLVAFFIASEGWDRGDFPGRDPVPTTCLAATACLFISLAGVSTIYIIRQIMRRQRERFIRLYEDPA